MRRYTFAIDGERHDGDLVSAAQTAKLASFINGNSVLAIIADDGEIVLTMEYANGQRTLT